MHWARKVALTSAVILGAVATTYVPARGAQTCSVPIIVHSDGAIEFDGATIKDDTKLAALLHQYHKQNPKCSVRLIGDQGVNFRAVGRVVVAMQKAGFLKVGFLTEPRN